MDLRDKVVLVTGASRGIGAAIARACAAEGAAVAVNYLKDDAAAEAVIADCKAAGGEAWAAKADVTSESDIAALVQGVTEEAGRIDVLVNNAFRPYAFDPENRKLFWDTDWADYRSQVEGALFSTYHLCKAALPALQKRPGASIVNMASDLVARPVVAYHEYATAKSALVGFSRNLAAELGPLGIRVNCVAPGLAAVG